MTTIFSILDTAAPLAKREDAHAAAPAQDFAHELARQDAPAKPLAPGKAMPGGEFEARQSFGMPESNAPSTIDEALPQTLSQTPGLQQLEEAQPIVAVPAGATEALLEARVYGWHAMAQSYLSELTVADDAVKQPGARQADAVVAVAPSARLDEPVAISTTVSAELAEQASAAAPTESLLMQPSLALDETAPATAATATLQSGSAPALWAERSLRFTRQRDGSSVAWLRDFRLGEAEASQLIRWVLNDARAKGLALGKIMLNGREAWTSPQPLRSTP